MLCAHGQEEEQKKVADKLKMLCPIHSWNLVDVHVHASYETCYKSAHIRLALVNSNKFVCVCVCVC